MSSHLTGGSAFTVAQIEVGRGQPSGLGAGSTGTTGTGAWIAAPSIQTWNGTSWTELTFHPWQLDYFDTNDVEMRDVSCGSPTSCAVHWSWDYDDNNASKCSQWDGTTFVETPIHGLGLEAVYSPGSCAPDGFCMYTEDEGDVYTWDGSTFTHRGLTPGWADEPWSQLPGWGFYVLDCTSATNCVGLGIDEQNSRWNGSSWEHLPSVPTATPGTHGAVAVALVHGRRALRSAVPADLAVAWSGAGTAPMTDRRAAFGVAPTPHAEPPPSGRRAFAVAWNGLARSGTATPAGRGPAR